MVQGTNNTIGGNSGSNYLVRNFISGNSANGVAIQSGTGNQVQGNFIGVGVSGTNGVGNLFNGIAIAGNSNTVGGTTNGTGNVISGNVNDGVQINSAGNLIQGNFVGTDYTGLNPLGNGGNGINITGAVASNNTVGGTASGARNIISANGANGVLVSSGSGNTISRNSIFANIGLGISLASGTNNSIVAPTLSTATVIGSTLTVTGSFTAATASVPYVLEFFANPSSDAEGKIFLGSLTVTPITTGTQPFTFITTTTVTGTDPLITATLTDNTGDISAFSRSKTVS